MIAQILPSKVHVTKLNSVSLHAQYISTCIGILASFHRLHFHPIHLHRRIGFQSCWNCGRPALETCGGCGIARYCGSFCQHRDWETGGHHATCNNPPPREPRRSASRSPPRIASVNEASVAAPIPASGATKGK
ncbi:hypothetical protein E2986_12907 [Frieseomelitta varia]|uniref:MYND-type domain-containing protein n=1 Tax=Frieseomelitta varia TaxID=561572 RepID=A0A833S7E3_9HYME|nr:hypothetical protein E2986_12907 [Frieseomelitta varia]